MPLMMRWVIAIAVLAAWPHSASAQHEQRAGGTRRNNYRAGGLVQTPRYMPAVGPNGGYSGMKTRVDVLRDFDGLTSRAADRYRGYYKPSPMREILDRQSLILPRSRMAIRLTESRGFTLERRETISRPPRVGEVNERLMETAPLESAGIKVPNSQPDTTGAFLDTKPSLYREGFRESADGKLERAVRPTYQDYLEERLKRRAQEAYETGLSYSYSYDPLDSAKSSSALLNARSHFELYRDATRDEAKPYFAIGIVSFLNRDYARTYSSIRDGILRVRTADDLRFDKDRFFKDPNYYRDVFDSASTFCAAVNDRAYSAVILSYTAFLYGDQSTALSAAEGLEKLEDPDLVKVAARYRKALQEAGSAEKNSSIPAVPSSLPPTAPAGSTGN
ncbi:MAG: hypothetical protein HRU71_04540 [Planctomycetia bacterium]|nr:MAG: hypothetical protein HRU71_04540 [Planctomycetia bacterium]